jgi:two-component system response regulator HydG
VLVRGESRHRQGAGRSRDPRALAARQRARWWWSTARRCPESILESELFGYEKGAFTGATTRARAASRRRHGGTLFLDEIGEISRHVQVKLLRVLQEGEIERLGGSGKPRRIDIRLVAATNVDLAEEVRAGRFREDLFYR